MIDIEPFVTQMRKENHILERNGAQAQAEARDALLRDLTTFFEEYNQQPISTADAASRTGVHVETVRRALRAGEIGDPEGNVRVLDLPVLAAKRRSKPGEKIAEQDDPLEDILSKY